MSLPDYLKQGERARLFPVLATTSKEGRATSILLACMSKIDEFGEALSLSVGQKLGKRSRLETYTEVVFKSEKTVTKDRPDGLIVISNASREWRALVEAKVAKSKLDADQIERYRQIAKEQKIDCVITISNQFATRPDNHPVLEVRKSRSKIPVYHWSWMYLLTNADLLIRNQEIEDEDQELLLKELRRFLTHDSTGVTGFDRMPPAWSDLNKLVAAGGAIAPKSEDARTVIEAWHQETRDLSLILSRQTKTVVEEKLSRSHIAQPLMRQKDELGLLKDKLTLEATLTIPDACGNLEISCDLARRSITVGMHLKAPEDKVSTKARLNWVLRQIKTDQSDDLHIRLNWAGRRPSSQFEYRKLIEDPSIVDAENKGGSATSFFICMSKKVGAKFSQQTGLISELEEIVPLFYREVGQNLDAWKKAAPKIREDVAWASDVSVDAMSEDD